MQTFEDISLRGMQRRIWTNMPAHIGHSLQTSTPDSTTFSRRAKWPRTYTTQARYRTGEPPIVDPRFSLNMQSSLASPPLFGGPDDLYEAVDVQQFQNNSPLLLQEEMLDLMNMDPMFGDDQTTLYPPPATETSAGDEPLVHLMDMGEDELAEDGREPAERVPATLRARPSTVGRMLFPARESSTSLRETRSNLPQTHAISV